MHRFGGPNADENLQDLHTAGSLRHRWIEAVAALFDRGHVETGCICNRLKKIRIRRVCVCPRNGGMLSLCQRRNRLRESKARVEVRIMCTAAIASPPTRIQRE